MKIKVHCTAFFSVFASAFSLAAQNNHTQLAFQQEVSAELTSTIELMAGNTLGQLESFVQSPFFVFTLSGLLLIIALLAMGHYFSQSLDAEATAEEENIQRHSQEKNVKSRRPDRSSTPIWPRTNSTSLRVDANLFSRK